MAAPRRDSGEDRRRLFRRMEWVFVFAPPLLVLFIAVFGGAFLAWFFRIHGTTMTQRWIGASFLLVAVPGLAYAVKYWWGGRK